PSDLRRDLFCNCFLDERIVDNGQFNDGTVEDRSVDDHVVQDRNVKIRLVGDRSCEDLYLDDHLVRDRLVEDGLVDRRLNDLPGNIRDLGVRRAPPAEATPTTRLRDLRRRVLDCGLVLDYFVYNRRLDDRLFDHRLGGDRFLDGLTQNRRDLGLRRGLPAEPTRIPSAWV